MLILIGEKRSTADEGIYNFAYNLSKGNKWSFHAENIKHKLIFFSLLKNVKKCNPDFIIYVPTASLTIISFLRAKLIKKMTEKNVAIIGLQPRFYNKLVKKCLPLFRPDFLFIQTKKELDFFKKRNFDVSIIPSGVDLEKFTPVNKEKQMQLRKRYNISEQDFVVSHIGPLRKSRNLHVFEKLSDVYKILLVGSTSLPQDKEIKQNIISKGGIVIDEFLPNIEEIYQLSDVYIFPVQKEGAAISFPLTILEAMACNIPVISTRFGALAYFLKEKRGFFWADTLKEIWQKIDRVKGFQKVQTRKIAEKFSWENVAARIENAIH